MVGLDPLVKLGRSVRSEDARDVLRYALYVWYSCCGRKSCAVVSFGSSSRSVSVTLDEVFVVVR